MRRMSHQMLKVGLDGIDGLEIPGQMYAKSTFGAKKKKVTITVFLSHHFHLGYFQSLSQIKRSET